MKRATLLFLWIFLIAGAFYSAEAQEEVDHSYKPLVVQLDDSGHKYLRFITWHQIWVTTNNQAPDDANFRLTPSIRRSRLLAYAQISPRFLILTHFGLNSLNPNNLSALGNDSDAPQLFLHGAWTEFKVTKSDAIYIGGGLHYWKGLSRLSSQSTLNFMTLDQSRPFVSWHSLGVTDQFARHLGIYAKGAIDNFDYRLAWNTPHQSPLNDGGSYGEDKTLAYTGFSNPDQNGEVTGGNIIEGYARYNFFDKESIKLPYNVGTYLGAKKIFAIGAGFFAHPNGMYDFGTGEHSNIFHLGADIFLDYPVGGGNALNALVSYMNFDYGENYVSRWAGTGNVIYSQVGLYLGTAKVMPYIAFQNARYQGFDDPVTVYDIGLNYFVQGHNAKLTLEWHNIRNDTREVPVTGDLSQFRLQAHIFL